MLEKGCYCKVCELAKNKDFDSYFCDKHGIRMPETMGCAFGISSIPDFSVQIKIPELNEEGQCNHDCPLYFDDNYELFCGMDWMDDKSPTFKCPRFQGDSNA